MATHDYDIANQSGANFRSDLNNCLDAIVTNNSNSSAPSTTFAYMLWVDTANNLLKLRNSANNAWITLPLSVTTSNTVDINGGAIDGTAIGASSASTGAFTTLSASSALTANAGVVVDNITIDGTEIDLSSGDLTIDVAGDIILDADGGDITFNDGGTTIGQIRNSSSDFTLQSSVSDKDIKFVGNDGGSDVTALTLDMSEAGNASFNGTVTANAGVIVDNITIDGTEIDLSSGDLTIDVAGGINLDSDGGEISFKDAGTEIGKFNNSSSDFVMEAGVQDKDMIFKGNDGGSAVTALTLDMSAAGAATFNSSVTAASFSGDGSSLTNVSASVSTTFDAVGTYCFANSTGSIADRDGGATLAGSSLRTANAYTDFSGQFGYSNEALSGTWRLMGQTAEYAGGSVNAVGALCTSLWVRIS
jgi:hypothetical protein